MELFDGVFAEVSNTSTTAAINVTTTSHNFTTAAHNLTTTHHNLTTPTHNVTTASHNVTTTMMTLFTNFTTLLPPTTTEDPGDRYPQWVGYVGAVIAVLFFGSNFVPVKKYKTGDGIFFQWVMCTAVWLVGLAVYGIRGMDKPFYPIVMVGGAMWSTGNLCVVPIIKCIGLGLGMLIWGSFNLLSGWASGRFGWFGMKAEVPYHPALNYIGVGLALLSSLIYMLIKTEITEPEAEERHPDLETSPLLTDSHSIQRDQEDGEGDSWVDKLSPKQKRIVGIVLSMISGILYGLSFAPAIHCQDNYDGASKHGLDYVFMHFCGIYAASSFYFFAYCALKKNKPDVYPQVILPAAVSGAMWAVAQSGWFVANESLSEPVAFPIITTGPGIIAALWGVGLFGEVQGRRNLLILALAFAVTITGAVLCGLSKDKGLKL